MTILRKKLSAGILVFQQSNVFRVFAQPRTIICVTFFFAGVSNICASEVLSEFRVYPYLQNPTQTSIEIIWLSEQSQVGSLEVRRNSKSRVFKSSPELAKTLRYHKTELEKYSDEIHNASPPYLHRVIIDDLKPSTEYEYSVIQNNEEFKSQFRTSKTSNENIRFVVYSDAETEPESIDKKAVWPSKEGDIFRKYFVNQSEGYRHNINIIDARRPDFILISGDLVESGNEQRDWDEFWKHNSGEFSNIASRIPIFPAIGNHENYPGPDGGSADYIEPFISEAISRFKTYFYVPENSSSNKQFKKRYYRIDYGPVTIITIDSSDGALHKTNSDTNWRMNSKSAPDFNPGSEQYSWLETQLKDAQKSSRFTFIQFHHSPYSSGPHGLPAGNKANEDVQSGVPLRVLTPLFIKYGVAAVFAGHDEMYERSLVDGVHFYDVGIGGDGLRGSNLCMDKGNLICHLNPYQSFLAHTDSPELWQNNRLLDGGKHYGHIEVNVYKDSNHQWNAKIVPAISFPAMHENGSPIIWERRVYNDIVILKSSRKLTLSN